MRKNLVTFGLVIVVGALLLGAFACGGGGGGKKTQVATTPTAGAETPTAAQGAVAVTLVEYQVVPKPASVPAGTITFTVRNIGGAEHTFAVLRTDLAPDALPTKADGSADESGTGVTVVDQLPAIQPQQGKSLTVDLTPGNYVLICNLVQTSNGQTIAHYEKGMHATFTVTQ